MANQGRSLPALEARGVSFSYRRPVVRDFTLGLHAGTITGIIGPNGSGKTTALRLLGGILRPHAGSVLLNGTMPVSAMPRKQIARHIAIVAQSAGDGSQLTVLHFALQGRSPHLSLFGFESARDEELTFQALEMTRLTNYAAARVCELSGGERQRLLLARALVQEPEILLLDELTANLDINYQVELMSLVSRLTRERRLATLVVSHEIHLLARFADRVALMSDGTILRMGTVQEVVTRENLARLFGMDFQVQCPADGRIEILPIIEERRQS
jgi:iron complex transport system ATP-binding protein